MSLSVVGAGFGRTGTFTLRTALVQLGFGNCYHMADVFENQANARIWHDAVQGKSVDWESLFEGYKSAVDWPPCYFWQEFSELYPESKVILTHRDPKKWYQSFRNTIYNVMRAPVPQDNELMKGHMEMVQEMVVMRTFDDKLEDEEHMISIFNKHNEDVKATCDPKRLLVYEVSEGWDPLCKFLGVPVPSEPLPRTNSSEDFQQNFAKGQAPSTDPE